MEDDLDDNDDEGGDGQDNEDGDVYDDDMDGLIVKTRSGRETFSWKKWMFK